MKWNEHAFEFIVEYRQTKFDYKLDQWFPKSAPRTTSGPQD